MLNKTIIFISALWLVGCVQNMQQPPSAQNSPYQVPAYPLTKKDEIVLMQQRLKNQGFNPGSIDGKLGPNTEKAIRRFQQAHGYHVDGLATTLLLQQLDPAFVQPSTSQANYDDSIVGVSTVQSAGIGAAIGATIGALAGGKEGALIGAGAGALAGAGADAGANMIRVQHAETEHQLNLSLDQIRRENARLKQNIDNAKKLIEEDKRKLRQLNQQLKNKSLSTQQAQQQIAELTQSRELLQNTYNDLLAKQQEWRDYAATDGGSQEVDQEIEKLNAEIASLRLQLDELDQLRSISISG